MNHVSERQPHASTRREQQAPPLLELYVEDGCAVCPYAMDTAERVRRELPEVAIEVVNLTEQPAARPAAVFAVPTFILDGAVVSLGSPAWDQLAARLRAALAERADDDDSPIGH